MSSTPSGGIVRDVLPPLLKRLDAVGQLFFGPNFAPEPDTDGVLEMIGKEIKYLDYWCRETWEMILHEAKDPQNNCLHGYLSSSLSARVDHLRQLQIALMASQDRVETLRLVEEMRGEVDELLEEIARDMGNKLSGFLKDRGLEPFQAHLMRLRMLLSDTITRDLSEAKILLAKIRGDVASFEDAFHEINQSQKAVEGLFGTVEQLVDDLLSAVLGRGRQPEAPRQQAVVRRPTGGCDRRPDWRVVPPLAGGGDDDDRRPAGCPSGCSRHEQTHWAATAAAAC